MKYKKEIDSLKEKRTKAFHLDFLLTVFLLAGTVGQIFLPVISPFFGFIVFAIFYRRLLKIVHTPCPRCKEPFGTKSNFILSIGPNKCSSCELKI